MTTVVSSIEDVLFVVGTVKHFLAADCEVDDDELWCEPPAVGGRLGAGGRDQGARGGAALWGQAGGGGGGAMVPGLSAFAAAAFEAHTQSEPWATARGAGAQRQGRASQAGLVPSWAAEEARSTPRHGLAEDDGSCSRDLTSEGAPGAQADESDGNDSGGDSGLGEAELAELLEEEGERDDPMSVRG